MGAEFFSRRRLHTTHRVLIAPKSYATALATARKVFQSRDVSRTPAPGPFPKLFPRSNERTPNYSAQTQPKALSSNRCAARGWCMSRHTGFFSPASAWRRQIRCVSPGWCSLTTCCSPRKSPRSTSAPPNGWCCPGATPASGRYRSMKACSACGARFAGTPGHRRGHAAGLPRRVGSHATSASEFSPALLGAVHRLGGLAVSCFGATNTYTTVRRRLII